jgi:cellobiose phosphorylase
VRPTLEGLEIKPCLPDTVTAATVKRVFRGKTYEIELSNRDGKQSYVCKP